MFSSTGFSLRSFGDKLGNAIRGVNGKLSASYFVSEAYSHWVHSCVGDAAASMQQAYGVAMRSSRSW